MPVWKPDLYLFSKYRCQVDGATLQHIYRYGVLSPAEVFRGIPAVVQDRDLHRLAGGIYDPILPHPGPLIQIELGETVMACGGRGEDLDHQVRRALAPDFIQLAGITHHRDIRLHQRVHIVRIGVTSI